MKRTVAAVGGVVAAVAFAVVLALAYLQPGAGPTSAPAGPTVPVSPMVPVSPTVPVSAQTPSPTGSLPSSSDGLSWVWLADLPVQAQRTVALIDAGGPFPYEKDGATFHNFEGILPAQPRGYYREYTVPTPGERDRGARRMVTGDRDRELFYTADHYETFFRVQR